jgi:hypothetical protein
LRADPICGCFDNPERLDIEYLPSGCGPRVRELANCLRLDTVVPTESGSEWSLSHLSRVRANQGNRLSTGSDRG